MSIIKSLATVGSVISKHRKNYEDDQINHFFHWNDVKILHKETHFFNRSFSEMVYIKKKTIALIKSLTLNI